MSGRKARKENKMDKYMEAIDWFVKLAEKEVRHGIDANRVDWMLGERLDGVKMVATNDGDITPEEFHEIAKKIWKIRFNEEMPDYD